jgi:hypothetical protein
MEAPNESLPATNKLAAAGLILLMALGSVFLWVAIPVGWLVIASRLTDSSQPSLGPYLVVIIGIPVSMFAVGRLLGRLNGAYESVTGKQATVRVQMPWHRSMRGEREDPRPRTVLDVVMVCSVGLALFVFGIWFFFFAGSSLPGA